MNDVDVRVENRDHLEYEELLPAAAFGTLTPEEKTLLQAHLATCDTCPALLVEYRQIAAALPLTLDEVAPSVGLRDKIAASIGADLAAPEQSAPVSEPVVTQPSSTGPEVVTSPQVSTRPAPTPIGSARRLNPGWLAAMAAVLIVALLGGGLLGRTYFADEQPGVETIAMSFEGEPYAAATGEVKYLEDQHVFLVETKNLPALPEGQVYQVWMIDAAGPKPMGPIDTATGTYALTADRDAYDVLAITVEPGPLGSTAPTTPPFALAPLTEDEQ